MKTSHKIALLASVIVVTTLSIFSWVQYQSARQTLFDKAEQSTQEEMGILGHQITHWLNGKLRLIDMMAESINQDFSRDRIQQTFDNPLLKKEFLLIFGGLETDGKKISNNPNSKSEGYDARKRPWYPLAKQHRQAVLTNPYIGATSGELLISAVANFYDKGEFKGAFGGDLSLKAVSEALNTLSFNGTGYAFLLNQDGRIISHPDNTLYGKSISELLGDQFAGNQPQLNHNLIEASAQGQAVYTAFHPLEQLYGKHWYIGVVLEQDKVMADAQQLGINAMIATVISALICCVLLYYAVIALLKPLHGLHASLLEINRGEGDLTQRLSVKSNDEFGLVSQDFNHFIDHLQGLISRIKQITKDVHHNSQSTSQSASTAADSIAAQLQELDKLALATHEMHQTSQSVAQHAEQASNSVHAADQLADKGTNVMLNTRQTVADLFNDMEQVVTTIQELSEYSNNIESILTVITGIAEQTNLLALNAAIEAARAGESGRGFAVVADEVRALAARTQQSTEEIHDMIVHLQSSVQRAEKIILTSRDKASEAQSVAVEACDVLSVVRRHISEINQVTVQIATVAEQQSAATHDINANTQRIKALSEQVSDQAQEQEKQCQAMANLAAQQDQELSKFKV
ncbi:methyl-accepting chemotaxis protein [Oceanospirillum beijerinckii]|uniref:methyl-accepting chemotaxis protein n=1 Tax=Oceanospirillum beijerinckii TaxID=64976 RepID=UPI0004242B40|nr:methyl-accepting chemotaxis protein [Oceanospirillum beijerinckii]